MTRKWIILYAILFVASAAIFSVILFPDQKISEYVRTVSARPQADLEIKFDTASSILPWKLNFKQAKIRVYQTFQIAPDTFSLSVGPLFFFKKKGKVNFNAELLGGKVNGFLTIEDSDVPSVSGTQISMSNVNIPQLKYKNSLADMILTCTLNGQYQAGGSSQHTGPDRAGPSGLGHLSVKNVVAVISSDLFKTLNIPKLEFSQIKLDFTQKGNTIKLVQCLAQGPVINIKLNGDIVFADPVLQTQVKLNGRLLPDSPYLAKFANVAAIRSAIKNIPKNGIGFTITGTLERPKMNL